MTNSIRGECRSIVVRVAEIADQILAVAPVLLDLDPRLEIDLRSHEFFAVLAGHRADLLEHLAVLADDDALVAPDR